MLMRLLFTKQKAKEKQNFKKKTQLEKAFYKKLHHSHSSLTIYFLEYTSKVA